MLVNLISRDNYNTYNIELAHVIGLHEAIYLNELINIQEKATRKNKLEEGFFSVDRNYIKQRTTLKPEEQKDIDIALKSYGILYTGGNKDSIKIDLNCLITLLNDGNEIVLKKAVKDIKEKKKTSKAEIIKQSLKNNIRTDNNELRNSYCEWIDSVIAKRGYMSKKAVAEGQNVVDAFCNRDLDLALKIISIATVNSYIDMNWAINNYKNYNHSSNTSHPIITDIKQLNAEVF